MPLEEKWTALEEGQLSVRGCVEGKRVILIDDKFRNNRPIRCLTIIRSRCQGDQWIILC
jgi:hypothetical protein